jgi:hypothetical protein
MRNDVVLIEEFEQGSAPKPYATVVAVVGNVVQIGCTCRGWTIYKGKTRECTHTKKLIAKHRLTVRAGGGVDGNEFQIVTNLDVHGNRIGATAQANAAAAAGATKATPWTGGTTPAPAKKAKPLPTMGDEPVAAPKKRAPKTTETLYGIKIVRVAEADDADSGLDPYVEPMLADKMPGLPNYKVETVLPAIARYRASTWMMEEKYDGERVTLARLKGGVLKAWSRPQRGNDAAIVRVVPQHIADVFAALPPDLTFTLDGEEYVPGGYSSDAARLENTNKLVLTVFDITRLLGQDTTGEPWDRRREYLEELFSRSAFNKQTAVQLAPVFEPSAAKVKEILARRGEGVILKRRAARYQPGRRSADFLKVKGLETALMIVEGFKKGKLGPYARVLLRNPLDNSTTTVKTLNNVWLKKFEQDGPKYKGRKLWIEYQFRTPDGGYRHPMWDRFEDE